jgi:hypothetical protein
MITEIDSAPSAATACSPVRIDARLVHRIGVREWGLPSMCVPGKLWRSEQKGTISCMTAKGAHRVNIETFPLVVVGAGEAQWMPDGWRAALWEYVQAWPSSGCDYGPFLALTEEQRCDFIRKMAADLVKSDNIGCRLVAHDIGQFAALDYELPEPKGATK